MQLKVNEVKLPAPITFNYEELKQELLLKAETYASLVYTEDQIQAAKKDRADLNRLKKALNDERMKREREYMQPFSEFKAQINEIISIIDKPCTVIDKQVKAFEEQKKAEKLKAIEEYWHSVLAADKVPEAVSFKLILDSRWLNASVSMKSIQDIIDGKLEQIAKDLAVIDSLALGSKKMVSVTNRFNQRKEREKNGSKQQITPESGGKERTLCILQRERHGSHPDPIPGAQLSCIR